MGFLTELQSTLNEEFNISITENGAVGYRTTGKALLDLYFSVSSLRNSSEDEIQTEFTKAYFEDRLLALKWLFFAGDVRQGLGERRLFRVCLRYLANNHPDHAKKLLPLVAEYTRWDNLLCLLDTALRGDVLALLAGQLYADIDNMNNGKSVSLLAKWLPSVNATSEQTRQYASVIVEYLKWTKAKYRKTLSALRKYSKVLEVTMSAREWDQVDYQQVPSRANLLYRKAFMRRDTIRRGEFLAALQKGEATINAGVLFPHDIVARYNDMSAWYSKDLNPYDEALEGMWRALPDYVKGENSAICVADGSGSMLSRIKNTQISALDVANALAIYFAERCSGEFKDKYITFSETPQLVDLSKGQSLRDKLEIAFAHDEVADTNIAAVFELILATAIKGKMKQKDLPKTILILSDMEFNISVSMFSPNMEATTKLFTDIGRRYAENGYKLPHVAFWNIMSRTKTIPIKENEWGVTLVSGFSPTVVKMVLTNEIDPYIALLNVLNDARYAPVEAAING